MAVTKQTYTATATWTAADLANLFRSAFIDAGLMSDWFDSFTSGSYTFRVLRVEHDNTKTYGTSFYYFAFSALDAPGISIASGWNASSDVPTGTQYVDYHLLPASFTNVGSSFHATSVSTFPPSTSSNLFLHRYTSGDDIKQSWFVIQQGTNRSAPFTILQATTALHPWLDLSKGIVSGYLTAHANVSNSTANVAFRVQENVRRCLVYGQALRGDTSSSGNGKFHSISCNSYLYTGIGSVNAGIPGNYGNIVNASTGGIALPVAKSSANPAFATDYVPICTNLPWSPFTSTPLASDFGVYMHYADNTITFQDKFIVSAGVEEWEVLTFANNATVVDGASATFLARVV